MSKLFLILYVAGKIGGTWGPLPYDAVECERRASLLREDIIKHEQMSGWEVSCEHRQVRPELGEAKP